MQSDTSMSTESLKEHEETKTTINSSDNSSSTEKVDSEDYPIEEEESSDNVPSDENSDIQQTAVFTYALCYKTETLLRAVD
jgi:hypothetical protein